MLLKNVEFFEGEAHWQKQYFTIFNTHFSNQLCGVVKYFGGHTVIFPGFYSS
jgi:hypothetical protein